MVWESITIKGATKRKIEKIHNIKSFASKKKKHLYDIIDEIVNSYLERYEKDYYCKKCGMLMDVFPNKIKCDHCGREKETTEEKKDESN